jgi:WD40 repeat protein
MQSREEKFKLENHGMAVRALKFHGGADSAGLNLISAGGDLHVFVTDVETNQRKASLVGHGDAITALAPHPTRQNVFLTASLDKTVKVWDLSASNKEQKTINMGSPVWGVAFSPNGEYFAATSEDGTISLINCKQLN